MFKTKIQFALVFCILFSTPHTFASEIVKRSKSGICHDTNSPYYQRTHNFSSYESLSQCLADGGRLPKGQKKVSVPNEGNDYSRDMFGKGWADVDGDCQNTRHEVLIKTSTTPVVFKGSNDCSVIRGRWISPFTNEIHINTKSLDIDHLIPLSWAWSHGAKTWTQDYRESFANDERNLLVVEASLNRQKSDKGPDEWLPPANQCAYIARFERIRKIYSLKLSSIEERSFEKLISKCSNQ